MTTVAGLARRRRAPRDVWLDVLAGRPCEVDDRARLGTVGTDVCRRVLRADPSLGEAEVALLVPASVLHRLVVSLHCHLEHPPLLQVWLPRVASAGYLLASEDEGVRVFQDLDGLLRYLAESA